MILTTDSFTAGPLDIYLAHEPRNVGFGFDTNRVDYDTHGYLNCALYLWRRTLHVSFKTKGSAASA